MSAVVIVRDIAIIVLAFESLVVGLLLILLIIQMRRLAKLLQEELKPILDSADETASTVRGTASFVSNAFVSPLIRAASFISGADRALKALMRRRSKRGKR